MHSVRCLAGQCNATRVVLARPKCFPGAPRRRHSVQATYVPVDRKSPDAQLGQATFVEPPERRSKWQSPDDPLQSYNPVKIIISLDF